MEDYEHAHAIDLFAMGKALKYIHVSDKGFSVGIDNYFDYSAKDNTFTIKSTAPKAYIKDLERKI